jgi:hypothetical protein
MHRKFKSIAITSLVGLGLHAARVIGTSRADAQMMVPPVTIYRNYAPAPVANYRYVNPAPAVTYRYVTPAPAASPRYVAPRQVYYAPVVPRRQVVYYYPPARTTPFTRYQNAVNSGRDPNWATGRGVPLYKPGEY